MKVSVYSSFGDYSRSLDVEYDSTTATDCKQAETYIFHELGNDTLYSDETEVTEGAET